MTCQRQSARCRQTVKPDLQVRVCERDVGLSGRIFDARVRIQGLPVDDNHKACVVLDGPMIQFGVGASRNLDDQFSVGAVAVRGKNITNQMAGCIVRESDLGQNGRAQQSACDDRGFTTFKHHTHTHR